MFLSFRPLLHVTDLAEYSRPSQFMTGRLLCAKSFAHTVGRIKICAAPSGIAGDYSRPESLRPVPVHSNQLSSFDVILSTPLLFQREENASPAISPLKASTASRTIFNCAFALPLASLSALVSRTRTRILPLQPTLIICWSSVQRMADIH